MKKPSTEFLKTLMIGLIPFFVSNALYAMSDSQNPPLTFTIFETNASEEVAVTHQLTVFRLPKSGSKYTSRKFCMTMKAKFLINSQSQNDSELTTQRHHEYCKNSVLDPSQKSVIVDFNEWKTLAIDALNLNQWNEAKTTLSTNPTDSKALEFISSHEQRLNFFKSIRNIMEYTFANDHKKSLDQEESLSLNWDIPWANDPESVETIRQGRIAEKLLTFIYELALKAENYSETSTALKVNDQKIDSIISATEEVTDKEAIENFLKNAQTTSERLNRNLESISGSLLTLVNDLDFGFDPSNELEVRKNSDINSVLTWFVNKGKRPNP